VGLQDHRSLVCAPVTKMNWNSTQFDGSMPLTITAASGVGKVLKHCTEGQRVEPRYSFYM
jgi:hypothetical protein